MGMMLDAKTTVSGKKTKLPMKSKTEQLVNRGFVIAGTENEYLTTSFEERVFLLNSELPTDRTVGARLLAKNSDMPAMVYLIEALIKEKKLYSKIEICNSLVSFGKDAVVPLIGIMGMIVNNQHKEIPEADFKKKNYPLPRDIAGRIIVRIGKKAIPELLKVLESSDLTKLSEAIDAIGSICFYEYQTNIFGLLKRCFYRNLDNDLIQWKIFRALSAFPESEPFLKEQQQLSNERMRSEIERSLSLIRTRKGLK
jgi:hypothetical protein